jgi:type I restriction enzyme S subunit
MTNGFVGTVTNDYVESEDGVLYVQGYNVEENSFNFHGIKRVSKAFHTKNQKSCLRAGDILTIQTGDIGVTTVVPPSLAGANCHALVISRFDQRVSDPGFYCQYFNSERGRVAFKEIETGSTMKHLNVGDMVKLFVPSPPVAEQRAIAAALSDVDALLANLDQLIAKKRDLKQAAMQQLLTGQTRLPGFSGEWEVKPMRALGHTFGGLAGKTKADFGRGDARYIPFMNVMTDTVIDPNWLEYVDVAPDEMQNLAKKGDLFFNGSSETPEEVGFCSVLLEEIPNLYLNSFCFGFRFNADARVSGLFFAYWFRSNDGRMAMSVLAQGATRYNIAKSAFMRLEIPQPSAEEQTAIATVLSDMDAELAALEARRDKTRALKQGMMQELLAGRIRLV